MNWFHVGFTLMAIGLFMLGLMVFGRMLEWRGVRRQVIREEREAEFVDGEERGWFD